MQHASIKIDKSAVYYLPVSKEKHTNSLGKRILWISFLVLDITLHKTSRIEILRQLAKRGCDVYLIAMESKQKYQLKNSGIQTISIPLRNKRPISSAFYVLTLLFFLPLYVARIRPDFVIIEPDEQFFSFIPTLLLFPFRRFKVVLDIRSTPVEILGLRGYLKTFRFDVCVRVAKKLFDGITIITPLMKKEVCERFDINPDRVGVWTSGVCTTLFNPKNNVSESMKLKRKLGLSGKFIVFYHGGLDTVRGLIETIEAMKILKSAYPNVVFFLLGTGPEVPMLKDLIKREELQNKVIIYNPVDYEEVPKFIGMSDVCVDPLPNYPIWRFQCPLKLLEYLAMGKTVIISDIPAHRLIVGEEKCGIYLSLVNPTEIEKSIIYAYHSKEKLGEWGKTGRRIVAERYTWEKVARDLENYLLSIEDRTD